MTTRRLMANFAMAALLGLGMRDHAELAGQSRGQAQRRSRYRNTFRARVGEAVNKIKRNRKRNKAARRSRLYNLRHA